MIGFRPNWLYDNVIKQGYDKWAVPLSAMTVKTQVEVRNIYGISTRTATLHIGVVVRKWWTDPRLIYPAEQASPDGNLLVAPDAIWTPIDVDLSNVRGLKPLAMAKNFAKIKPDGSAYTSVLSEAYLPCSFDVRDFPYDHQSCLAALQDELQEPGAKARAEAAL